MTRSNILGGWRGAGIFPENHFRVLHQLPDDSLLPTSSTVSTIIAASTPYLVTSSPPDATTLRSTNQAFFTEISTIECPTPIKRHVRRLSSISERLQAENILLKAENKDLRKRQGIRNERQSRKRIILKGKVVVSTEEVHKALAEAEAATKEKKKRGRPRRKTQVSSDEEIGASPDSEGDEGEQLQRDVFDCIEVLD